MTPATKKQALVKLKAITNKIGYPEQVGATTPSVVISRDDAMGNGNRADQFEFQPPSRRRSASRSTASSGT